MGLKLVNSACRIRSNGQKQSLRAPGRWVAHWFCALLKVGRESLELDDLAQRIDALEAAQEKVA